MTAQQAIAGQIILAVADNDIQKAASLAHEASKQPLGTFATIIEMATVVTETLQLTMGDEWRELMNVAVLDLTLMEEGSDA